MKIHKEILNHVLVDMPSIPPEAGGIIGGKNGEICLWEFDRGCGDMGCVYRPNVISLNDKIAGWMDNGFDFMGILHVHFGGAGCLSDGDRTYIQRIMKAMPDSIEQLYFPLFVQPQKELISYKAVRDKFGEIEIKQDEVVIIED